MFSDQRRHRLPDMHRLDAELAITLLMRTPSRLNIDVKLFLIINSSLLKAGWSSLFRRYYDTTGLFQQNECRVMQIRQSGK